MYFIIFEILQYFTPKMLGIGFSGTRSRLQNNYPDDSLPYLVSHLRRSLCILKIKALVTALQFIPIDCLDLLPLDYAVVNVKTYRDSERQMLNIFLTPPQKQRK
jgi:hypothetical protein